MGSCFIQGKFGASFNQVTESDIQRHIPDTANAYIDEKSGNVVIDNTSNPEPSYSTGFTASRRSTLPEVRKDFRNNWDKDRWVEHSGGPAAREAVRENCGLESQEDVPVEAEYSDEPIFFADALKAKGQAVESGFKPSQTAVAQSTDE